MYRIGNGYDVHRLVEGRKLILGGVNIPHSLGLDGHSDADVLCHALCDSLLGASGAGDLGQYFPDTDNQWQGVSSLVLLKETGKIVAKRDYQITNIDTTIVAQQPKLASYIQAMSNNIAECLNIDSNQVNVKATTTEKLGFTGREEGISAYAVVLLQSQSPH
jgi:2-C-methyl-D-erythritol 2,4-cyclodiphosphate synthase